MKGINNRQKKNVRIKREYRKAVRILRNPATGIGRRPRNGKNLKAE